MNFAEKKGMQSTLIDLGKRLENLDSFLNVKISLFYF